MRLVDPIVDEIDQEAPITRRILAAVPEDKLPWKPHAKSMSLARLAQHVAEIQGRLAQIMVHDSFDPTTFPQQAEPTTLAEIMTTFETGRARAKELICQTGDERALQNWSFVAGGQPSMTLPRIAAYRVLL